MNKNSLTFQALLYVFLSIGFVWGRSSYEKITGGKFVDGLEKLLVNNAHNNPFVWYKDFLETVAIPNSTIFGSLTMWGEFLTAVSILGGSLYLILKNIHEKKAYIILTGGLIAGIFLNINFWLAFSWTSAANDSLNTLMILVQLIGAVTMIRLLVVNIRS